MDIKDKRIIVTGGANGIGRELALTLAREGGIVGVLDNNERALEHFRSDYPRIYFRLCDVSKPEDVEESIEDFCRTCGVIDILVNNAGIIHNSLLVTFGQSGLVEYDRKMWDRVISVNLSSVFYVSSQAVLKMVRQRKKGLIINVSSICAAGNLGQSAYSAAKAGVNALTVTWAKELSLFGVRVAGIAPGFADTETTISSMQESVLRQWTTKTPLRRLGLTSEIVNGILFIIQNDFFNGRVLELDGGLRL